MTENSDSKILGYIRDDLQSIKADIKEMRSQNLGYMLKDDCPALSGKCDIKLAGFVTRPEFAPVKYVVFSLVMVILAQVVRMVVTGEIK